MQQPRCVEKQLCYNLYYQRKRITCVNILAGVENININVPWDSKLPSNLAISLKNDKRYNF
jgi:hypothetical protein